MTKDLGFSRTAFSFIGTITQMVGVFFAIGLIFGLFLIKLRPEDKGLKPYGYDPDKENQGKDLYTETKSLNVGLTISASLATSFFIFFILGSIMNGMSNGATLQFPPALQEGVGLEKAGVIMSAYLVIGIFGKLVLGRIDDKYGITKALMFGSVTLALSFVAILFIDRPGFSYIFPVIFGFGLGMGSVLPPLVTSSIYNKDQYGNAYGFAQSGTQIGSALGPLLVSIIYDTSGSYNGAWILNIVFAILTGSFWALAHHNAKKFAGKTIK